MNRGHRPFSIRTRSQSWNHLHKIKPVCYIKPRYGRDTVTWLFASLTVTRLFFQFQKFFPLSSFPVPPSGGGTVNTTNTLHKILPNSQKVHLHYLASCTSLEHRCQWRRPRRYRGAHGEPTHHERKCPPDHVTQRRPQTPTDYVWCTLQYGHPTFPKELHDAVYPEICLCSPPQPATQCALRNFRLETSISSPHKLSSEEEKPILAMCVLQFLPPCCFDTLRLTKDFKSWFCAINRA